MIKFNEVTWYSKLAAVIFFIGVLPIWSFYIGIEFQRTADMSRVVYEPAANPVKQPTKPTPVPTPTTGIKIGETAVFGSISIRPISVEEDSRCPANANCIWAGRVRVKILVNGKESIVTLGQEFTTENVVITLTEVLPQKTQSPINTPSDYRFIFTVTKKSTPAVTGKCYVGGCSGQICSDKPDAISTCEYTEAYACYKTATCERQLNGQCGWTETASLRTCLGNK